jgi:hypothetical protein
MNTNFSDLTKERIAGILNTAMDDGEWHTPSAHDIKIHTQNTSVVYGWCNISKHNTYHDKEAWFNINGNTVQIWEEEYRKGLSNLSRYRAIYNLKNLGEVLEELRFKPLLNSDPNVQVSDTTGDDSSNAVD